MATALPSFPRFDIHADEHSVGTRWTKYVHKLENMFIGMAIDNKKRKKALLLHYAGDEVFEIHDTLADTGDDGEYDKTKAALENYFKPQVNKEFEIFEFRRMKQFDMETVDQYATRLRQKAENCSFADKDAELKKSDNSRLYFRQSEAQSFERKSGFRPNVVSGPDHGNIDTTSRSNGQTRHSGENQCYQTENQRDLLVQGRNYDTNPRQNFQPRPTVQPRQSFQPRPTVQPRTEFSTEIEFSTESKSKISV